MKKRLFNIHKFIGVNVLLFFFISLFFGILTIFQPYINTWEDSKQHVNDIKISDIDLDKCLKQITKRTYFGEDGKKVRNDIISLSFPSIEVSATNLIRVRNRPNFYLDPNTCKRVRPKNFKISQFFDKMHTGGLFNSLLVKILFGFMSVAVVFLCFSCILLIIKNKYSNKKTKSNKAFYAKYHRLLFFYTLPLIFMFGITGALFNLGLYSSPLLTHYLTKGETLNALQTKRNILFDPALKNIDLSKKIKSISVNELYTKATQEFDDISFYKMEIYNYNDINSRVKFIGYEPKNFFISSMTNESYIILDGTNAKILDKKIADDGTFAEKTLDAIFYLHYLRTFSDLPRIIFAFLSISILIGLVFAMSLWLERAKKDKFSYKVLKPLSFTIILGSLISSSFLFASVWFIPKSAVFYSFMGERYSTQETLFYLCFLVLLAVILFKKDLFKITKYTCYLSSGFLICAVIAHELFSGYSFIRLYQEGLIQILASDIILLLVAALLIFTGKKLPKKYFEF